MQLPFDFPLTEFEKATLWQLTGGDCKGMINQKNIDEAKRLTHKWAVIRKHKGLKPYA